MVIVYLVSAVFGAAVAASIVAVEGFGPLGIFGFVGALYAGAMVGVASGVAAVWSRKARQPTALPASTVPSGVVWC